MANRATPYDGNVIDESKVLRWVLRNEIIKIIKR